MASAERNRPVRASRVDIIEQRLNALRSLSLEVEAAAVISVEGLTISSSLPEDVEDDRVSAMTAAMLAWGERIAADLDRGKLEQVYIKGASGYVLLTTINEQAVLTVLASDDAKLGLIFLDMRQAVADLLRLL